MLAMGFVTRATALMVTTLARFGLASFPFCARFWLDQQFYCYRFIIDSMANILLDVHQVMREILTGKTDSGPTGTRPCGSTNAVHIIFSRLRQVIVKYMADIGNMQATGGNIGGD